MAQFDKYKSWISELAPLVGTPQFDVKFKRLAKYLSRSESFQLKMEIKRQAKPCNKVIDLRGKVDGNCEPFDYQGTTHYLDDIAAELLAELIEKFNGHFVETIYDALHNTPNNFRVIRQHEDEQQKQAALKHLTRSSPDPLIAATPNKSPELSKKIKAAIPPQRKYIAKFGQFFDYKPRQHERMQYVTKLMLITDNGQFQAVSVNISSDGMLIKLGVLPSGLTLNQHVCIDFVQLKDELKLEYERGIAYEVVYHNAGAKDHSFGLKLLLGEPQQTFKTHIEKMILGNKFRYKVDTHNVEEAVLQRAYEFQTVATTNLLPVYTHYDKSSQQLRLLYTLQNAMTREIVDNLDIGKNVGVESVFKAQRMQPLLNSNKQNRTCLLMMFKLTNNQGVAKLFAAFDYELQGDLAELFYFYARKQSCYRQYLIQYQPIDGGEHNLPSILHNTISKDIKRHNMPISPRNEKKLNEINGLMTLVEVSTEHWQRWGTVKGDFNKLKQFEAQQNTQQQLQVIPREFVDKRIDIRYPVKSNMVVSIGCDDFDATSCDISVNGLQVAFNRPIKVKKDEVIKADLVQLQGVTKLFKLSSLEYKVVGISHNHTRAHMVVMPNNQGQHVGKLFFRELIKANKTKLKPDDVGELQEISSGLTNLLIRNQNQSVVFISQRGKHFEPSMVLSNNREHIMFQYCTIKYAAEVGEYMEIYQLLRGDFLALVQDKIRSKPDTSFIDLLLACDKKGHTAISLASQFDDDTAMLKAFVKAKKAGYKVKLLRAVTAGAFRFNPEAFRLELKYVKHYAPHRADKLLNQLGQIKGLCHMFDVTAFHCLRWKLNIASV